MKLHAALKYNIEKQMQKPGQNVEPENTWSIIHVSPFLKIIKPHFPSGHHKTPFQRK